LNEVTRSPSAKKEENKEELNTIGSALINEPVTEADVHRAVKKYAEVKNQNKQFQAYTMFSGQLVKFNNSTITILLNNEAQLHTYTEIKQEFLDYIRTELKNNLIQVEVDEHKDSTVKKALTPSEKFNLMAAKNPLLLELRKRLDLDPTF